MEHKFKKPRLDRIKIKIGETYNGRKVLDIYKGFNFYNNWSTLVAYKYSHESNNTPALICSLKTFMKHANYKNSYKENPNNKFYG